MTKKQKIISIALGALALLSIVAMTLIIIFSYDRTAETTVIEEAVASECPRSGGVVTISGATGKTALELLKSYCEVETKTTNTAEAITSIDGISTTNGSYWAFYVNDQYASSSPDQYQTLETDTIKWQLESIGI